MRRKIVKQGPTTMMVSLPISWVREYGLEKGDEIDLEVNGNSIKLSTSKRKPDNKTTVKISSAHNLLIWRTLQSVYEKGFDEIVFEYEDAKVLEILQDVSPALIGFEITEQSETRCVFKAVASELDSKYNDILKQAFNAVVQSSEAFQKYLEKKGNLNIVLPLEQTVNRLSLFLKRLLNKKGINMTREYLIVYFLEKVSNEYRFVKLDEKMHHPTKELAEVYEKVHELLLRVRELYFVPDKTKLENIIVKGIDVPEVKAMINTDPATVHTLIKIIGMLRTIAINILSKKITN